MKPTRALRVLRFQAFGNGGVERRNRRTINSFEFPFFVEQVFAEVPDRSFVVPAILRRIAQPLKHRMLVVTVYYNALFRQGEFHPKIDCTKLVDFVIAAFFLFFKVVGWHSDNVEFWAESIGERLQLLILSGEATVGGGIYDECFFTAQFA